MVAYEKLETFLSKKISERKERGVDVNEEPSDFIEGYLQEVQRSKGQMEDWVLPLVMDFFEVRFVARSVCTWIDIEFQRLMP